MNRESIYREFEGEYGYDPVTTSNCDLTNWLVNKLIEARDEVKKLQMQTQDLTND